jgi:hypothetical protein
MLGAVAWYFSSSSGYIAFTNGLKIQWLRGSTDTTSAKTFSFPINFSSSSSWFLASTQDYLEAGTAVILQTKITGIRSFQVNAKNSFDLEYENTYYQRTFSVIAIGY